MSYERWTTYDMSDDRMIMCIDVFLEKRIDIYGQYTCKRMAFRRARKEADAAE